jgi:hypothetical protein
MNNRARLYILPLLAFVLALSSFPHDTTAAVIRGVATNLNSSGGDISSSTVTTTGGTAARTLANHFADRYNAADFGATCDGISRTDVNLQISNPTVSSASYTFTNADIGKTIVVSTADGKTGLTATISSIVSGNAIMSANWPNASITNNQGRATWYLTDNTTAINTAYSAIVSLHKDKNNNNTTGFDVGLPNGVCASGKITVPRFATLGCANGQNACTLFLKSGTNTSFVVSENFSSLTGTGLNSGNGVATNTSVLVPTWFGLHDIHIDGNRAGNSSGNGVDFYGNASILKDVYVEQAAGWGIYSEASGDFAWNLYDWKGTEEGVHHNVVTRSNGNGELWRGPHDTVYSGYTRSFTNDGYNYRNEWDLTPTTSGGTINNGGVHIPYMHTYTNLNSGTGTYLGASNSLGEWETDFDNAIIAGTGTKVSLLYQNACGRFGLDCLTVPTTGLYTNIAMHDMTFGPTATGVKGINLVSGGGPTHIGYSMSTSIAPGASVTGSYLHQNFTSFAGLGSNYTGASSVAFDYLGSYGTLMLNGFNNTKTLAYSSSGRTFAVVQCYTNAGASGTCMTGTPAATDFFVLMSDDPALPGYMSSPGPIQIGALNAIRFPASDNTRGASLAIGPSALNGQTATGLDYFNTGVGGFSLGGLSTLTTAAVNDTCVGYSCLANVTSGTNLTAMGVNAGLSNTTGTNSVFYGLNAGEFSNANNETFLGYKSGQGIVGTPLTGIGNTAVGSTAGILLQGAAASNTILGNTTGNKLTTGSSNLVLGAGVASTTLATGSSNILLGTSSAVDTAASSTSNYLNIGNLIAGDLSKGIVNVKGTVPVLSGCGTGATVATGSGNSHGTITEGTGASGCTITFANTHTQAPDCVVKDQSGLGMSYTVSASAITVTNIGALSSTNISYVCLEGGVVP